MVVGISGARKIGTNDIKRIHAEMNKLVTDSEVEEIVFGGALGTDTWALVAAFDIRETLGLDRPKLTVIVPNAIFHQPKEARKAIHACADKVIQLTQPIGRFNGFKSLFDRNIAIINRSDIMICFPLKSNKKGGTRHTMWESKKRGVEPKVIELEGITTK